MSSARTDNRTDTCTDARTDAAPWVLLRGLSRSAAHWGDFPAQLAQATGRQVLCIDLPGNGAEAARPSPIDIAPMARHCRLRLREAGISGPVHLLALSMGAMVAVHWASTWPQELRSAVLINSSLRGLSPCHQRLRPRACARLLRLVLAPASPLRWENTLYDLTSQRPQQRAATVQHCLALRAAQPTSRRNALRQLLASARFRAPRTAPAVPLRVLAGLGDQLVDPRCSQAMASRWGAPLHLHPDAGHDLPLDDPAWLLALLQAGADMPPR